ncbi:hypothetical protein MAM1_0237d08536 [Mucor ambiguus]|uniref:Uncharacterized protein n=1 Tax=Mucor ambiguus TaxID=91626 RepID=A0A0C9MNE6_9FUNG|nr:hypothetical protein MAM1_0237d08536 [Mucor ambiguus]
MPLNIVTNVSFEDENEVGAVDVKPMKMVVLLEQLKPKSLRATPNKRLQMMLPYLQLQNTAKFGYIRDLISHAKSCFRPSE